MKRRNIRPATAWTAVASMVGAAILAFTATIPIVAAADDAADTVTKTNGRTLREVPFTDVKLADGFWAPRIETNRIVSLPHNFQQCEETGRFTNFAKAGGLMDGEFEGIYFNDSDVYKVLEGASYSLAAHPDPELEKRVDGVIAWIASSQQPDGYLNSYYELKEPDHKWSNLAGMHELYCAGHLFEGAVAHYRATGKRNFLDVAIKLADCIDNRFGDGKVYGVPGHEEIELALVKLYEVTGEQRYLKLAEFFLNQRGNSEHRTLFGEYCQDHVPLQEQRTIVGHAVRAMYLYSGTADVAGYTHDPGFIRTLNAIWDDVTRKQMYITGGIGALAQNEGFGTQYELPNASAYCETCAAIGLTFWAHRMNLMTGDSQYADMVERCLYNGVLSGVSLGGDLFFYENPLQSNGGHHRQPFFGCACCPSNVVRVIPSIPGYVYAQDADDNVYVNLFVTGKTTLTVKGVPVTIEQETNYPWDADVKFTVTAEKPVGVNLLVRNPSWNGGGYAAKFSAVFHGNKEVIVFNSQWSMAPRRIEANPQVAADRGRVAIQNGAIVYCLESCYNDGAKVTGVTLPMDPEFKVEFRPELLGGVNVITFSDVKGKEWTATPYNVWDHGEPGQMIVWLRQQGLAAMDPATDPEVLDGWDGQLYRTLDPLTLDPNLEIPATTIECDASHCHNADDVSAAIDGVEPSDSCDRNIPRMTWWNHRGTSEWIRVSFPTAREISKTSVYWFDDEVIGAECRVPQSWKLQYYNEAGEWVDVTSASEYGTAKDRYNTVTFTPVTTSELRIVVQLRPGMSGGILEWKF